MNKLDAIKNAVKNNGGIVKTSQLNEIGIENYEIARMCDKASSVLARLKNKAKESGRSYQLCLQLFCQEEFLRRLQKSKYVENLVLKGGLFIYSLTEFDSRVTVDVDFLLKRMPNTPEQLRAVVEEIIAEILEMIS